MGILPSTQPAKIPTSAKRKSTQIDFGSLAPLNTNAAGTKNFAGYREALSKSKDGKKRLDDAMDSDAEDEDDDGDKRINEEADDGRDPVKLLSAEEAIQEDLLSEDVRKIKVSISSFTLLYRTDRAVVAQTPALRGADDCSITKRTGPQSQP
jgi:hypothetical protein